MYRAADNPTVKPSAGYGRAPLPIFTILSIAVLFSAAWQPARAQQRDNEYRVKAAFLFHFAQLVDWPSDALNTGDTSIILCVFEDEPSHKVMEKTLEGKHIGGRILRVRMLGQPQEIQGCNILFLSGDEVRIQTAILRSLRGLPVLTVGETDNFLADGGIIHFRMEVDKIRFDINASGAAAAHIRISSRLLLLATSVTQASGTGVGKASYAH